MELVNCTGINTKFEYDCFGYAYEVYPNCKPWLYKVPKNDNK